MTEDDYKTSSWNQTLRLVSLGMIVTMLGAWASVTAPGSWFEEVVARRAEFAAKTWLDNGSILDSRLKIFTFDAETHDAVGDIRLSLPQWSEILKKIGARNPKMILIDEIPFAPLQSTDFNEFRVMMDNFKVPVATGSRLHAKALAEQNSVDVSSIGLKWETLIGSVGEKVPSAATMPWMDDEPVTLGGHHWDLVDVFSFVGHANLDNWGYVRPFIRLNQERVVPHFSLLLAESVRVDSNGPIVGGTVLPVDRNGLIRPNLLSTEALRGRTQSLRPLLDGHGDLSVLESVRDDDIVMILTQVFPGGGDSMLTPSGEISASLINVSLANSALTGDWVTPPKGSVAAVLAGGLIGGILAWTVTPVTAILSSIALACGIVAFGLTNFVFHNQMVNWFFPAMTLMMTTLILALYRDKLNQKLVISLKAALSGRMSQERINNIVKNPEIIDTAPSSRVVSILFTDIVGFSQISERLTPQQALMDLKELLDIMRVNVLKHGGIVDKTLGDGMLAYFGYGLDGRVSNREHSDAAVRCAVDIQRDLLERNFRAAEANRALYPVRIGVNTSSVFVGNIGDAAYVDFTLIGNGVNLAKRLEAACQHYCVMVGATTYDLLIHRKFSDVQMTKKLIPIKHTDDPIEAFEFDPFFSDEKRMNDITAAYRKSLGIERKDQRWPVPKDMIITFECTYGLAQMNDFSRSGFSILLPRYVGNGVGMDLQITLPEGLRRETLSSPLSLHVEVRWGRPVKAGFLHGVMIKNLSVKQKEDLLEVLRAMVRLEKESNRAAS